MHLASGLASRAASLTSNLATYLSPIPKTRYSVSHSLIRELAVWLSKESMRSYIPIAQTDHCMELRPKRLCIGIIIQKQSLVVPQSGPTLIQTMVDGQRHAEGTKEW